MQGWVAGHGYLWSAFWEVTYRCNERCVHCYNPGAAHYPGEQSHRHTDELTTEEGYRLLRELALAGVFRLTISGGEAMLRADFFELVAEARRLGMSVAIYTNGQLLATENLERLARLWPDSVGISIYSADPDTHDAITNVPGSFDLSLDALKRLRARGIKTYLKSVQMKHTVGGYARVQDLAARVGAAPEIDIQMSAGVDGAQAPMKLSVEDPAELITLAATPNSPLFVGTAEHGWGYSPKDPEGTVCGAGVGVISIGPSGQISPCSSLPIPISDFRTAGFLEVWKRSAVGSRLVSSPGDRPRLPADEAAALLSDWQEIRLRDYHECGTHERCGWCIRCPGLSLLEHGDALAPSTVNCRLSTARMFAARLLRAGKTLAEIRALLGVSEEFGRPAVSSLPGLSIPPISSVDGPPGNVARRILLDLISPGPEPGCDGELQCCKHCPASKSRRRGASVHDGECVELVNGSPDTAAVLRAFIDLRDSRFAEIDWSNSIDD